MIGLTQLMTLRGSSVCWSKSGPEISEVLGPYTTVVLRKAPDSHAS